MAADNIDSARTRIITAMERSAAEYGLPRSCGRLYGVLFFAEEPLSLDDLADRSGYAKSTVSDITRTLEDLYLVRQTSAPAGGRRSYFEAERDLWYAFQKVIQESGQREVTIMQRALGEAETTLTDTDDAETDLERVRDLQATYEQVNTMLETLNNQSADELLAAFVECTDANVPDDEHESNS